MVTIVILILDSLTDNFLIIGSARNDYVIHCLKESLMSISTRRLFPPRRFAPHLHTKNGASNIKKLAVNHIFPVLSLAFFLHCHWLFSCIVIGFFPALSLAFFLHCDWLFSCIVIGFFPACIVIGFFPVL